MLIPRDRAFKIACGAKYEKKWLFNWAENRHGYALTTGAYDSDVGFAWKWPYATPSCRLWRQKSMSSDWSKNWHGKALDLARHDGGFIFAWKLCHRPARPVSVCGAKRRCARISLKRWVTVTPVNLDYIGYLDKPGNLGHLDIIGDLGNLVNVWGHALKCHEWLKWRCSVDQRPI